MAVVRDLRGALSADPRPSIVFDGRLDNRDEMRRALGLDQLVSDAELLLRAYLRDGTSSAAQAVGDFAFAIWDPSQRRLFCARDVVGVRPFYYRIDDGVFRASTELPVIASSPHLPDADEGMVAESLSGAIESRTATLFRGISRLPPAHALIADAAGVRTWQYWEPDASKAVQYTRDDEYEAHFNHVFEAAVRARCAGSTRPVGVMLSGGIDSASILVTASRTHAVQAYTTTFPGHPFDESQYARDVLNVCTVPSTMLPAAQRPMSSTIASARRWCDVPSFPNGSSDDLLDTARRHVEVMLTGLGGGEWLGGSDHHCADLLRTLRLGQLVRQIRANQRIDATDGVRGLARATVWPLIGAGLQQRIRRVRGMIGDRVGAPWIDPELRERVNLDDRVDSTARTPPFPTCAQRDIYRQAVSGPWAYALEACARTMASHGLDGRYPFHDRRLIEFALAIPEAQRWRGTQHKWILRQAMRGRVPDSVRARVVPDDYAFLFRDAVLRHADLFAKPLAIARRGWADGSRVLAGLHELRAKARAGQTCGRLSWWLWMVVAIEIWYSVMYESSRMLESYELAG
jgi:asparagine synthase (glutamine-hydrolysing)